MKTYRFKGERQYIEYFDIEVEANSLEEAQELIDNGEYEEINHNQDFIGDSDEIEFDEIVSEEE
jgi:hypothetical protein